MNTRRLEVWIWAADLAWIFLAFLGAAVLRYGANWNHEDRILIHAIEPFILATSILWSALSLFMHMDGFRGGWRASAVLTQLLIGLASTLAGLTLLAYFIRDYVSHLALAYFVVLLAAGFFGIRFGARLVLRMLHDGGPVWRVLVIGGGRVAQEVAAKIEQHPETLCKVVGLLFPANDAGEEMGPQPTKQFSTLEIFDFLQKMRVNEIIVALPYAPTTEIRKMIARARDMGISISLVPQSYELYAHRPKLFSLDGLPLLQLQEPGLRPRYVSMKRTLDVVLAAMLGIPAALILLPAAIFLLSKQGSVLRRETRIGQYGTPFSMWRLDLPHPLLAGSSVEMALDRFSITELPQLWNVVLGHMSLVGPRPEPPSSIARYSDWQQRRLRVKPGMTGLAQVNGLREYSSSEEKTRFDLQYVMNPHLLWDISLLLQTVWTLVMRICSPVPSRQTFETGGKVQGNTSQGLMPDAHRSQSSAD
jgi:lipopolysaccharide/colanic/teichoic acid biosynthesis glycosyltransferase